MVQTTTPDLQIADTVGAVAAQVYPRLEIIVINDGSSDDTADVLEALLPQYPNLRVVHLEQNQGKANALRMGR